MAKHKIFLVHGMGDVAENWSDEIQTLIRNLYGSYSSLTDIVEFDDKFDFVPVYYNDCFDKRRKEWAKNADDVIKLLGDGGLDKATRDVLEKAAVAPAGDSFFDTHILDVLMYRFLKPVAELVRNRVATRMSGVLDSIPGTKDWSIVAHSLGTAVTHDTLHAMYTNSQPGIPRLTPGDTRPKLLMTVANVSRVLETDADVYTSNVCPTRNPAKGYCEYFINAHHEWDPFLTVKRFAPADDWPSAADHKRYVDVKTNAFQKANVHAFDHYLLNPKVHGALFRGLTFKEAISQSELDDAITKYEASTPIGAFDDLRKKLKDVRPAEEASWKQVVQSWSTFLNLVENLV